MKNWIILPIIIILCLIEVALLDYFKIFGVKPDLLLVGGLMISLFSLDLKGAMPLSIFAGMLKDIFCLNSFGINTLLFALWSFLIVELARKITIDHYFIRATLIFIIALLNNIITRLIFLSLARFIPLGISLRIIFLESFYTAILALLIFKMVKPQSHLIGDVYSGY